MKPPTEWPAALAILLIQMYRVSLSPLKGGGCCRFSPTCSQYALEAYQRFGFLKGTWLTCIRILKCQPFYRGCLYDPVPEKKRKEI